MRHEPVTDLGQGVMLIDYKINFRVECFTRYELVRYRHNTAQ